MQATCTQILIHVITTKKCVHLAHQMARHVLYSPTTPRQGAVGPCLQVL